MKEIVVMDSLSPTSVSPLKVTRRVKGAEELVARIRQEIRRRTSGRVHNLAVFLTGTHVVLDGFCSSFHCYQLAQHAAMQTAEDFSVDNQIEVL